MGHLPTPLEPAANLGAKLGLELWIKRDDCTGIALGGNKVRQLEFYLGKARVAGATQILITGAVQSNFTRTCTAMAARLGLGCHVQMEDRVRGTGALYRANGNVLMNRLAGAVLHNCPAGEDEDGADARLSEIAGDLRKAGEVPFVVPLAASAPPTGALGYVAAAREVDAARFDHIFVASGSALTHCGLLTGLRLAGVQTSVTGICVRRDARLQTARVDRRLSDLADLLAVDRPVVQADVLLDDSVLAPGYGQLNPAVAQAIRLTAQYEGLFLDPVYTGKVMAGLIARAPRLQGQRVLFWHTGGQPALFAYGDAFA